MRDGQIGSGAPRCVGFIGLGTMGTGMAKRGSPAPASRSPSPHRSFDKARAFAASGRLRRPRVRDARGGRPRVGARRLVPSRRAAGRGGPPRTARDREGLPAARSPSTARRSRRTPRSRSRRGCATPASRSSTLRSPGAEGRAGGNAHVLRRRRRRGARARASRALRDGQEDHAPRRVGAGSSARPSTRSPSRRARRGLGGARVREESGLPLETLHEALMGGAARRRG
jgi:hypothetical protein